MSSPSKSASRKKLIAISLVVLVVVVGGGGYYLYQNSLQPNTQVADVSITSPIKLPEAEIVVNQVGVANTGSFGYTASQSGFYELTFRNPFSISFPSSSSKSVSVTYSAAGKSYTESLEVPVLASRTITVKLAPSQNVSGSFTVSGGSNNDIDFSIVAQTGTQILGFSFTLVNTGTANGFAVVSLQADGKAVWSNRYFVQANQPVRDSGTASVPDLDTHEFKMVVTQQEKA